MRQSGWIDLRGGAQSLKDTSAVMSSRLIESAKTEFLEQEGATTINTEGDHQCG
jgi:hypothetical protein